MTLTPPYEDDTVPFEIVREENGGLPLLRLVGEMDLRAATELREALLKALSEGSGSVRLDFARLTFIDSTIISVLIMARKRAETDGGTVVLRNVPGRIGRILSITGIDSLFPMEQESSPSDGS